jgi:glucose-1-phosphate thymidylyltransferase
MEIRYSAAWLSSHVQRRRLVMWGLVPAAGRGSRLQPLAFSKELLPVGSRQAFSPDEPCAVSEYIVERMIIGGADKICFIIAPGKEDILEYYGAGYANATVAYVVQPSPCGLCDAIFRVAGLIGPDEQVLVGLPDTIWFPSNGFLRLPENQLSFLLFEVEHPQFFDAAILDDTGNVREIRVKQSDPGSNWIWGAFKLPGWALHQLRELWLERQCADEYVGTLVNAYLLAGGAAAGIKVNGSYLDVGTLHGYRAAIANLEGLERQDRTRSSSPRPWPNGRPAQARVKVRTTSG